MILDNKPYTLDRIVRIGIAAGLLWGLIWLLGYLSAVLIPFAVALLLAYLINPLVLFVQKKVTNRIFAVFISLFVVLTSVTLLAWLLVPMIVADVANMGRIVTDFVNDSDLAERAASRLPPQIWEAIKDFMASDHVRDFFRTDNFWKISESIARKALPGAWGLLTGTASFIMGLVGLAVIGLYLIFLLLDYEKVKQGWKNMLPPDYQEAIMAVVSDFQLAMNRYFRAQAEVASIVGILFSTGFWLIDLPMGILLGLLIGILNMVPYLQLIGLIPAFLLALVHAVETGSSFWVVLGLTGSVFVVVQIIQDTLLVPKIMGRVTGLSPAIILLSLSIWGKLLGFFGLIIALPMTCLILAYYRRFLSHQSGLRTEGGK
ncbi:MAG: AI-2E family transporter [Deltaproteobacteria bacterium]|nr:AI-2E family transporter [Deltaproteobacteria bacterium]MBW1719673.1 AI-2E family transporter [Deltaproteobacteria bacterium]MBW1939175.1 AI-2E family transporter [Deltaproteobacteria bacterium]MBW1965407.1 AI-2E family transporter [Deltaproteobacteria bacterium]MBW2081077.1 AI-2E family transporter [Deltaproteobacteria bacterium]